MGRLLLARTEAPSGSAGSCAQARSIADRESERGCSWRATQRPWTISTIWFAFTFWRVVVVPSGHALDCRRGFRPEAEVLAHVVLRDVARPLCTSRFCVSFRRATARPRRSRRGSPSARQLHEQPVARAG